MRIPVLTAVTAATSTVAIAFAILLDHYHYGSQSLRNRLQQWLNAIERIHWHSLVPTTARISLHTDTNIFGARLISARLFIGILLILGATAVPTYAQAQRSPGNLVGVITLAMAFGSISIPLGLLALHFARWSLRIVLPRASAVSSIALILLSTFAAQTVFLIWTAVFSVFLLAFLTVCYNHAIYITDSALIVVFLLILAYVYSQNLLPAALFPLVIYIVLGALIFCLWLSSDFAHHQQFFKVSDRCRQTEGLHRRSKDNRCVSHDHRTHVRYAYTSFPA